MEILVLSGSPRKNGNSAILAEEFAGAARDKGHTVTVFHLSVHKVNGCLACERCWENGGAPCVQKDDMQALYPLLNLADVIVFSTPSYYFGFTAQLKAVIDRFYPMSKGDKAAVFAGKQTALLVCGGGEDEEDYEGIVSQYERMTDYLEWDDIGIVIAPGVSEKGAVRDTQWMEAARDLAMNL